ncbi:MAG: M20/M25/M40 family metallo-hydrolase [Elusimicrobia bacterium]|nr:M20/M25/M40 family metallo-hydrolase [Elusimicrobiota bacterium]
MIPDMIDKALSYCEKNKKKFVGDLSKLVAIPSVSFPGFPAQNVVKSAKAVADLMKRSGLEHIQIIKFPGAHPYVYGDWLHAPGKPTLLLYAHHDVQPPGRTELWKSPPFKATERNGRLYGRGAADDKAGVVVHTSAVAAYLETAGKLPLNVKLIIEGEEESGSTSLEKFLKKYARKMQADAIVLTDTGNFDVGLPSITTTLRGLVALDMEVKSMDHPLHSGMWGGPIVDPVLAASKILASLTDEQGRIAIPGIYDDVRVSDEDRRKLEAMPYTEATLREQAALLPSARIVGGDRSILEKGWRQPSVSVNAIQASSKKDCANIINESVWCHVGIRTVPDMDMDRVADMLVDHLKTHAPWGVQVNISNISKAPWWKTEPSGPVFEAARRALAKGYGCEPVNMGCGGSIPFVGPFASVLGGAPALLIGVEDPYTNPHSENESLHLGDFQKAISSAVHLYEEIARTSAAGASRPKELAAA